MNLLSTKKNVLVSASPPKHNPFWPLQNALDNAMSEFYGWFEPFNFPTERFENILLHPAIDIVDSEDQFKVEAEMPGMGEEDVQVSINNNVLTIKGEKTTSKQDKSKNYRMREISYGSYERSVLLPDTVDVDKAKASFKKGMLWVVLPKKPESTKKSCTIPVEKA
ncbi:MAG: heat-shock protein [Gammaproteobacteria bacterium]|nr:heat-shock protein [Gammaproteobacteria bacterium]